MLRQGREAWPQVAALLQRCLSTSAPALRLQRLQDPPKEAVSGVQGDGASKADLVVKLMGPATQSRREGLQDRLRAARAALCRFPGDTGSSEVQVGALTERIKAMTQHMQTHRKDFSSRRGLEAMLVRRRRLLIHLRQSNFERYRLALGHLGLKDVFIRQDRLTLRMNSKRARR